MKALIQSSLLVLLLAPAMIVQAQSTGASIQGKVRDKSGTGVNKASVRARNLETGGSFVATTDDAGRYHVPSLPPGSYELKVSAGGFAELSRGLNLAVGQDAIVDLVLGTAKAAEESKDGDVISIDAADAVNLASGAVSGLINDRQIRDLPLNGRSFQQLAALQPGVIVAYSGGNDVTVRTPKLSIAGSRPDAISFLLDGTNIGNIIGKTPGSVAGVLLGVDAVAEFRVMTNAYSAEYGGNGGGTIHAATRWGGNEFHGSAFEFLRNSQLDAKNYFDRPGEQIPAFKRNQFGGGLGGPIKKDRTFFFASYESLIERLGVAGLAFVPDDNARRGIVGSQTIQVNPASAQYLNALFPAANGRAFGNGAAEYFFSRSQPTDEHFFTGRIDHRFASGDLLFGRYTFDNGKVDRVPANNPPLAITRERSRNQYATMEYQHLIKPTLLNSARLGFNRSTTEAQNVRTLDIPPSLSFVPGQPFGFLTIGGLVTELGGDYRVPRADRLNSFQGEDSFLYLRGAHAVRFGVQAARQQANQRAITHQGGLLRFADLPSFLRGTPLAVDVTLPQGFLPNDRSSFDRGFRQTFLSFFVQDDARLRDNLMLNIGLRYEFSTVPSEQYGRITALRSPDATALTVGEQYYNNPSLKNFAPRIGVAWDPFGKKTTAIRAGFGLFYDPLTMKQLYYAGSTNPPFTVRTTISSPAYPLILSNFNPATLKPTIQSIEPVPQQPYAAQFNFSIQQALPRHWDFTAAYVGARGIHLIRVADANLSPSTVVNGVETFQPQLGRRNPKFGAILQRLTDAQSFYNSLQLTAAKRVTQGIRTQINYAFSKSIDDASGINSADFSSSVQFGMDFYNRKLDRGLSNFDARHNLSMNWTADVPLGRSSRGVMAVLAKGWQLNNITTFQSGHPFTVNMGFNRSGNLNVVGFAMNERPSLKQGYSNNPVTGDPARYWDINAFQLPAANTMGTLGRNTLTGPSVLMMDVSAVKPLISRERSSLVFRAEAFNLLNHPNFATPSGRTSFTNANGTVAPDWGRITSTVTTSRQIQLGLKLSF